MRKTWVVAAALVLLSSYGFSQERSSWEAYVGYQWTYSDYGPIQDVATAIANPYNETISVGHKFSMTGANATLQKSVGKRWSAAVDIGGMYTQQSADLSHYFQLLGYIPTGSTQLSTFTPKVYTITFGPQVDVWKRGHTKIFMRGMGGALRSQLSMDTTTRQALNFLAPRFKTSTTDPAVMVGGGVQRAVLTHLFLRGSADYIHAFSTSTQNYIRLSGGIVIDKLGKPW
jgi:hypothetical protein